MRSRSRLSVAISPYEREPCHRTSRSHSTFARALRIAVGRTDSIATNRETRKACTAVIRACARSTERTLGIKAAANHHERRKDQGRAKCTCPYSSTLAPRYTLNAFRSPGRPERKILSNHAAPLQEICRQPYQVSNSDLHQRGPNVDFKSCRSRARRGLRLLAASPFLSKRYSKSRPLITLVTASSPT